MGRRGFSMREPWIPVVIVVILSAIAMVTLRRIGSESKVRIAVMHSLAILADSQDSYRRRHGTWATHLAPPAGEGSISLVTDQGSVVTLVHADSLGWYATATHPRLQGRQRTCYIFVGDNTPHDPRLTHPREPLCW